MSQMTEIYVIRTLRVRTGEPLLPRAEFKEQARSEGRRCVQSDKEEEGPCWLGAGEGPGQRPGFICLWFKWANLV